MKRSSTGYQYHARHKSRIASNSIRCLTGYRAKGSRIVAGKGNHTAICCPSELVKAAYDERNP